MPRVMASSRHLIGDPHAVHLFPEGQAEQVAGLFGEKALPGVRVQARRGRRIAAERREFERRRGARLATNEPRQQVVRTIRLLCFMARTIRLLELQRMARTIRRPWIHGG